MFIAVFLIFTSSRWRRRGAGARSASSARLVSRADRSGACFSRRGRGRPRGHGRGLGLGLALARWVSRFMIGVTELAYGTTHSTPVLVVETWVLVVGVLLGIVTALAAAYLPARTAARLQPVEALAKGRFMRRGREQPAPAAGGNRAGGHHGHLRDMGGSLSLPATIATLFLINLAALLVAPSLIGRSSGRSGRCSEACSASRDGSRPIR